MEIELHPTVSLLPETFNVLVAPVEMLTKAQSSHLELQRYKILNICGRSSGRLDRNNTSREVRRANTLFQLMTIQEENHHRFLIVEHDPLLCGHMVEHQTPAPKQTSGEATILLYSPDDGSSPAEDDGAG